MPMQALAGSQGSRAPGSRCQYRDLWEHLLGWRLHLVGGLPHKVIFICSTHSVCLLYCQLNC